MNKVLPSAADLLEPTLKAVQKLGGVADIKSIEIEVIEMLKLDSNLVSQVRIGKRTELAYRLSWARTRAKNLGYLVKKGNRMWALTEKPLSGEYFK